MKSIFTHLFKKKDVQTPTSNEQSSTLKHHFETSSEFIPQTKTPLLLAGLLILVVGVFGYQFMNVQQEPEVYPAPIGMSALNIPNASDNELAQARLQFENQEIDESITTYKKLLSKAPHDPQVLNDLGVLYLKKQAFKESEGLLKRSIEEAPTCVVCLNNLGYLKTLQGSSKEAESFLKKALTINNSYIDPYFNLGVLYEKNGDFASSVSAYNEYLSRSKDNTSPFNLKLKQHVTRLMER